MVFIIVFCLVTAFHFANPVTDPVMDKVNEKLKPTHNFLHGEKMKHDQCMLAFYDLIDAIVLLTPQSNYPHTFGQKLLTANELFRKNGLRDQEGQNLVRTAYTSINSGKKFQLTGMSCPAEVKELAKKKMEKSQQLMKQGNSDSAIKHLTEIILMVITPIEKK